MRTMLAAALTLGALAALAGPAQAAFPGTPGRLAYVQGDTGGMTPFGVSTSNADGSAATLLRPTCQENVTGVSPRCPSNPAWSRDGTRLAFDRFGMIFTTLADGSARQRFTVPGLTGLLRPAWDPTGTQLVFQGVDRQGKTNLYISAPDGTAVRQLTFAGGSEPNWSLKGAITFVRNSNVYVIGADGKGKRRITGKGGAQPNWSPYASQITFVRKRNVYRVRTDAKGLKRLTGKGGYEPAWSPDGKRVLFHRNRSGNRVIYSVNLKAADLRLQTRGQEGRIVNVFSPDQQPLR